MLKKTSASIGLVVATAAGILLSGAPAQAQGNIITGCCSSHHSRHHSSNRNHNRTRPRIFIRIFIYNKNNNAAVARNGSRQRSAQIQRRRRIGRRRPILTTRRALVPLVGRPRRARTVNDPVTMPQVGQRVPRTERVSTRALAPRSNGQVSRNGVVRPQAATQPGARVAGPTGNQANPAVNDPNVDIGHLLDSALS